MLAVVARCSISTNTTLVYCSKTSETWKQPSAMGDTLRLNPMCRQTLPICLTRTTALQWSCSTLLIWYTLVERNPKWLICTVACPRKPNLRGGSTSSMANYTPIGVICCPRDLQNVSECWSRVASSFSNGTRPTSK